MKVLLLAKSITAHTFGGMETHVEAVAAAVSELGHEVTVITTAHPHGLRQEVRDGVTVEYLQGTPPHVYSRSWWEQSVRAVRRRLAGGPVDLLLSFSLAGYGVASAGLPVRHYAFAYMGALASLRSEWHNVSGLRGLVGYLKHALVALYFAVLERRLRGRIDGILATHDQLYEDLRRRGQRALLCYNGTDPRQFRPDHALRERTRHALGIPTHAPVLLMVATLNRQKGIWVGLEAFERLGASLPGLHLVIVGDGPERRRLEEISRGGLFGRRVHFVGAVEAPRTAAYFATADIFLYPTFRTEGLPLAIVEAMSAGLPVVASDRGGIRSAVRDGETGLLLPFPEVRGLAEAVESLLTNPDLAASLGRQARKRALAEFDNHVLVARLLEEILSAVGRP